MAGKLYLVMEIVLYIFGGLLVSISGRTVIDFISSFYHIYSGNQNDKVKIPMSVN
jgi:hypothetical protein